MQHSFKTNVAKVYGVEGAVMMDFIHYWMVYNAAHEENFKENRYWVYKSLRALCELYPYWTKRQLERIINNLKDDGAIVIGNFNDAKYDRTSWYRLADGVLRKFYVDEYTETLLPISLISPNGDSLVTESGQPLSRNGDTNTITNNNNIRQKNSALLADIVSYLNEKTGKSFKPTTRATAKHINARLKEGFVLADFKKVVDIKVSEWGDDSNMKQYLRPATLFGTKFESYLQQELPEVPKKSRLEWLKEGK